MMAVAGRVLGAICACVFAVLALPAAATPPDQITEAKFSEPTTRYAHGVLGDAVEWGALELTIDKCFGCDSAVVETRLIRLPQTRVFEDLAPRIFRDDDGSTLVAVVESDANLGARLSIYDQNGLYVATPFIGRANRWLAPIGAADFDGDGWIDLAYIDRPHLAKTLRVWRLDRHKDAPRLSEIASKPGLTNHRIGDDFVTSGLRDCGQGPEIITVDANWQTIMATRLSGNTLTSTKVAPFKGQPSMTKALSCEN